MTWRAVSMGATEFSEADPGLVETVAGALVQLGVPVERGAIWTTDAPFRETRDTIDAMTARGLLAVEMEAAALYAFAAARRRAVLCFAHVTNYMALIEGDFEKGEADGTIEALAVIRAAADAGATPGGNPVKCEGSTWRSGHPRRNRRQFSDSPRPDAD